MDYYPGHGHYLHNCDSRCLGISQAPIQADTDIRVQLEATGFVDLFAAFQYHDEFDTAILAENSSESECYLLALCELLDKGFIFDNAIRHAWPHLSKFIVQDIDSCCWRIDHSNGLLH
jgi:hypothetical protein